jgi:hypothetical protein
MNIGLLGFINNHSPREMPGYASLPACGLGERRID